MARAFLSALSAAAALGATPALGQASAGRIDGPAVSGPASRPEACQSSVNEVVVCGERGASPYRIDPDLLAAMRADEGARSPPAKSQDRSGNAEACVVGPLPCPGQGGVDIVRPVIVIATAMVKAAQGEDWREPFRTRPDSYEIYQSVKARRAKKQPRVAVSFGR